MDYMEVKEMTVNMVRRLEEKETAKGGIFIPDTAKENPQEAEAMAVGADKIEKGKRDSA
jgi:chaperonin GroES